MNHFTKEEIEEIAARLAALGVRDSDLPETAGMTGDDFVAIVQEGKNKRIDINTFRDELQNGPQGESAYEVAVRHGFIGTESAWLSSLYGLDGISIVSIQQTQVSTEDSGINIATIILSNGRTVDLLFRNGSAGHGAGGTGETAILFKSIVFTRSVTQPATPSGGTYANPIPDGGLWTDGVPSGDNPLWMSTRWFSTDPAVTATTVWSTPAQASDTLDIDFEYSSYASPGTPTTHPELWHNTGVESDIWMAMRTRKDGVWGSWSINKIKGENGRDGADGQDGTSVIIKGSLDDPSELPQSGNETGDTYLIDGHMWVWDGDSWEDMGELQGPPGQSQYIHVAYSNDGGVTFTANGGTVPGRYFGYAVTTTPTRPDTPSAYSWAKFQGEDGFGYEYIYKLTEEYAAPDVPPSRNIDEDVPEGWSDDPLDVSDDYPYCWMCSRKKANGIWSDYHGSQENPGKAALLSRYGRDGAPGADGISPNTSFKSIVFRRSNATVSTPTGGSYANPIPEGWSDGVPTGEEMLWMSTRLFSSDGLSPQEASWTTPSVVSDTEYMDYEFSSDENPGVPAKQTPSSPETNPKWSNTATVDTIWMAVRNVANGFYETGSSWQIIKIKGEKGDDGTSLNVKGHLDDPSELPSTGNTEGDAYLINGDMWVWDGDSWEDVGTVQGPQGEPGENGLTTYLHIKYSDDGGETFTDQGGEVPGDYIGTYTDFSSVDSADPSDYLWKLWKGEDGFGYEYIYQRSVTDTAPAVPQSSPNIDDYVPTGWSDDPDSVSASYPYCWVCYRKKVNGTWSSWIGSSSNPGYAALFSHFGKNGEDGISPNTSFKSIVFRRSNTALDTPTGGSYANPVPPYWSDGVPSGDQQLWMSTRIFSSDGNAPQQATWTVPTPVTDTEYLDYEFSSAKNPGTPSKTTPASVEGNPNWSADASSDTVWMAVRPVANGAYEPNSSWTVMRIKGEDGNDGTSLNMKGSLSDPSELPLSGNEIGDAYLINGNMYVWDGDSWNFAGHVQGPPGEDGESPYLHIKYSNDGGVTFTDNQGETPGDYIGMYWDYESVDSLTPSDYAPWNKWKGEDGFGYEYIFQSSAVAVSPAVPAISLNQDNYVPTGWYDDPISVSAEVPYCWVCYRKKTNGVWGGWVGSATSPSYAALFAHYGRNGVDGVSPNTAYKSSVFKRSDSTVTAPIVDDTVDDPYDPAFSGNYSNPVPYGWSDGVPSGTGKVWMSTRVFSSDGQSPQQNVWSTPVIVADNEYLDYEFSSADTPGTPAKSSPSGAETNVNWSNTPAADTVWMAFREVGNGAYLSGSTWTVVRVKGEDGTDGTSIIIKGTVPSVSDLPSSGNEIGDAYVVGDDLYVWDGDEWVDCGQFKGDPGVSSYLHIKYSNDGGSTFTANSGETPGEYIGIKSDSNPVDSMTPSDYLWSKWEGKDGFGYEYIYQSGTDDVVPNTPVEDTTTPAYQQDGHTPTGWSDDPVSVSASTPCCYTCYRKKTDGVWGAWIGSSTDHTRAALYSRYGKDGRGIRSVAEYYGVSADTSTEPTSWSQLVPELTAVNRVLWNYEVITYTDNDTDTTDPAIIGMYGHGRGIATITEYYLASSQATGVTTSTPGWTTSPQATSSSLPYLWNYEVVTYTDNSTPSTSTPVVIGHYGSDGQPGATGTPAYSYRIVGSTDKVAKSNAGVYTPRYVSVRSQRQIGSGSYTDYTGAQFGYLIDETWDASSTSTWQSISQGANIDMSAATNFVQVCLYISGQSDPAATYTIKVIPDGPPGPQGPAGPAGTSSPSLVYRGIFNVNPETGVPQVIQYHGSSSSVDVVKYSSSGTVTYHKAKTTAGTFTDSSQGAPSSTYWEAFEGNFESVASTLLFSERASIVDAAIQKLQVEDLTARVVRTSDPASGTRRVQVEDDSVAVYDDYNNIVSKMTGDHIASIGSFVSSAGSGSSSGTFPGGAVIMNGSAPSGMYWSSSSAMTLVSSTAISVGTTGSMKLVGSITVAVTATGTYLDTYRGSVDLWLCPSYSAFTRTGSFYLGTTGGGSTGATSTLSISSQITGGTYYLWALATADASFSAVGGTVRVDLTVIGNSFTASAVSEFLHVFANGIGYVYSQTDYFVVIRPSNGNLQFEMVSGNAGLQLSSGSVQIKENGFQYRDIVPYKMYCHVSSGGNVVTSFVRGTGSVSCSHTATGLYRITLSSSSVSFGANDVIMCTANVSSDTEMRTATARYDSTTGAIVVHCWGRGGSNENEAFSLMVM